MAKAKANAAQGIPEMIQIATGKHFFENKSNKHLYNARYGWYSNNGKIYLYDVLDIKKKRATL